MSSEKKQREIVLIFYAKRFSFEILLDGILFSEPMPHDTVTLRVDNDTNIKIRALQYKYGRLSYSKLLLDLDVTSSDAPERIETDGESIIIN